MNRVVPKKGIWVVVGCFRIKGRSRLSFTSRLEIGAVPNIELRTMNKRAGPHFQRPSTSRYDCHLNVRPASTRVLPPQAQWPWPMALSATLPAVSTRV